MNSFNLSVLENTIKDIRSDFVEEHSLNSFSEINNGLCVEFAEEIQSKFPNNTDLISSDWFIDEGFEGDGSDVWNPKTLELYNSPPPNKILTGEIGKRIKLYHCWIYSNGLHFDAECPSGVKSLFDLPIFKNHLSKN